MIINCMAYFILGSVVGFLIKLEVDTAIRKRRVQKKIQKLSECDFQKENEAIAYAKELNQTLSLRLVKQRQG